MNDFLQSLRNGQAEKQRTPKTRKNFDNPYHHTSSPRFHTYGGYPNSRGQQHMKRPPVSPPHQGGNQLPMDDNVLLADAIENLTSHIETLVKTQEYMAGIQERTAEMIERQAIAIERIVNHLNMAPIPEAGIQQHLENHYNTASEEDAAVADEVPFSEPVTESAEDRVARKQARSKPAPSDSPIKENTPSRPVVRKRKRVETPRADASTETELLSRDAVMEIIHTMRDEGATFDQVAKRLIELGQPTFSGRGEWHAQTVHRLCSKK